MPIVNRAPRACSISDHHPTQLLSEIASAVNIRRDELLPNEDIATLCNEVIPQILSRSWLPRKEYPKQIAHLCIALAMGSLKSVINIGWNIAVLNLRERIAVLYESIPHPDGVGEGQCDDGFLAISDHELVQLCYGYNLISEEVKVALDNCRDQRNNASDAHPTEQNINVEEARQFIELCLSSIAQTEVNEAGIDMVEFVSDIYAAELDELRIRQWRDAFMGTYTSQQSAIIALLHRAFCECGDNELLRRNIAKFCKAVRSELPIGAVSVPQQQHKLYLKRNDNAIRTASCNFFTNLGMATAISQSDMQEYVKELCAHLMKVHQEFNNFYNEGKWARFLSDLVIRKQIKKPLPFELVEAIITCAVGNPYGRSWDAYPHYRNIIAHFWKANVDMMLSFPEFDTLVGQRIRTYPQCDSRFREAVRLVPEKRVSEKSRERYEYWTET